MFTDDKPITPECPRLQNKTAKCPRADVEKALEGMKLSYRTMRELRSVLYDVCWSCMRENTKNKVR